MQTRILLTALIVALRLTLLATLLLNLGMFPAMFARLVFTVVAAFEFGRATLGTVLLRFETLFALIAASAFLLLSSAVVVPAFGLEWLAALVLASILVASAGTVGTSGTFATFRGTVATLAVLSATGISGRLGLLKGPSESRFGRFAHQFQHFRGVVGHFDRFDLQTSLVQHTTGASTLVGQHDGHHVTGMAGAGGSSGTMQEGLRVFRRLHLDHKLHTGYIDAASRHVGGDHDVHVSGFESREVAVALVLAQVAVQFGGGNAVLRQILGKLLRLELGAGEQDAAPFAGSEGAHQLVTVALRGFKHVVGHLVDRGRGGVDAVHLRIGKERVHNLVHTVIERSGEQHDLRVERHLSQQSLDRWQEAHVGHLVGLVDDGDLDLLQRQRMLLKQVLKTSGASDHDVGAGPQIANLTGITHATVHRGGGHAVDLGERHQHVVDLVGQLTCRCQHQAAGVRQEIIGTTLLGMALAHLLHLMAELAHVLVIVGIHLSQTGDQRNRERQGLAGAGTATAKDIASGQGIRKRVGLDRESGFLAVGREHADQRAGNSKFGEGQWTFLLAGLIEIGGEGIFIFNNSGIGHNGLSCQTLRTLRKPINNSPRPILSRYGTGLGRWNGLQAGIAI